MKRVSVRDALQHVVSNPEMVTDQMLQVRTHELVCRTLFEIANAPDGTARGNARSNKARLMIFERLVGRRRTGSHPATRTGVQVELMDLTTVEELGS